MKQLIKNAIMVLLLSLPLYVQAQGFEEEEEVYDTVPLDGGVSLLAAAGIAYGAKKLHVIRKKQQA